MAAQEVVIDCSTGQVTVQADTFLKAKPAPLLAPAINPNQPLIDAINAASDCPPDLKAKLLAALQPK